MKQIISLIIMVLTVPIFLAGCNEKTTAAVGAPPPPEVDVVIPIQRKITQWDEYTGRFEAMDRVEVRSRVTGYLIKKSFVDGEMVKKGDVLFEIDPRPFQFEVKRARAQYSLAVKEYDRAKYLRKSRAISQEELDRRLQELKAAESILDDAKLNLEFTRVTAPFDGRPSDGFVDIGNLVRENDTILTTLISVNPVHFEFEASQNDLLRFIRLDRSGLRPGSDTYANLIYLKLPDEDWFSHVGYMDFVDNEVDAGTGTIRGRAVVENEERVIYPGMFGRARLIGIKDLDSILLPEKVVNTDQNRKFVYVVNNENKAVRTYVETGRLLDNGFITIRSGLKGDERVVMRGSQRIRSVNQPVTPNPVDLEWVALEALPDPEKIKLKVPARTSREANQDS